MSKSISDNARDEAAITHANKYVAIPRNKLALETWQLSIRDDFKSGWDAAPKHQAENVAGEFGEEDLEDAAQAYAYEHDTGGEPLEDFKAGALFQFNKDRERLARAEAKIKKLRENMQRIAKDTGWLNVEAIELEFKTEYLDE